MTIKTSHKHILVLLLFVIAGFISFHKGLDGEFVHTDNGLLVSEKAIIKSWKGLKEAFTKPEWKDKYGVGGNLRPLIFVSYSIDWWLSNGSSYFMHVTNLLLHIFSVYFLYLIFAHKVKNRIPLLIACLIYLVHPIHEEAIYEITQGRTDLLAAFFMLLSTFAFVKACDETTLSHQESEQANPKAIQKSHVGWFSKKAFFLMVIAEFAFICSILSKEIGFVTILFQVFIYLFLYEERRSIALKHFAGLALISIGYVAYKYYFFGALGMAAMPSLSNQIGYLSRQDHIHLMLTFSKGFFEYLYRFFYPINLSFNDAFVVVQKASEPVFIAYLFTLVSMLTVIFFCRKKQPLLSLGLSLFIGGLIPISHILPMPHFIGEHMFYIPAMGLMLCFYVFLNSFLRTNWQLLLVFIVLMTVFSSINQSRAQIYNNDLALTKYNFENAPYCPEAAFGYATILYRSKNYKKTTEVIRRFMEEFTKEKYTGFRPSPYLLWKRLISSEIKLRNYKRAADDLFYILPAFSTEDFQNMFIQCYMAHFGPRGHHIANEELKRILPH